MTLRDYAPPHPEVRTTRNIELKVGENSVQFADVATGIDATTVSFKSLTDPAAKVSEQNDEYDVVSADKLLGRYLGKQVSTVKKVTAGTTSAVGGTLLSLDAGNLVLQTDRGGVEIISRADLAGVLLTSSDISLVTKPTLVRKLVTEKAGTHVAQVTYQTDDLTWRADYNITISRDDTAAAIGAWVSILNESGAAYPDARIKLVASDVQRVQPQRGDAPALQFRIRD